MADAALATIAPARPMGMIALRGDLAASEIAAAVKAATGQPVPGQRRILLDSGRGAAWMSPDELLLFTPPEDTAAALAAAQSALGDAFATLADVSDARAGFAIAGPRADEVLMKLAPVDIDRLPAGEIRRSRAAQAAVAFWRSEGGFTLLCARSVAGYMADLLAMAAAPGGAVFPGPVPGAPPRGA
jgi:sarcosine oxidase subunit gamma